MPSCNQCHKSCKDYQELAAHIMSSKGHKRGRRWAAKYMMINSLSPANRFEMIRRTPDDPNKVETEFGDENRANMRREVSGAQKNCLTICPKCKSKDRAVLPVEFVGNPLAWRVEGIIAKLCLRCGG